MQTIKQTLLCITACLGLLVSSVVSAQCQNPIVLDPNTELPYTGNLEIINNSWGGLVEISTDYINGKKNGEEKVYYQSGALNSLSHYVNGVPNDIIKVFYEDGSLMIRMFFKNGLKEGRAVRYYPSGQLQREKYYENDVEVGESLIWYEDGTLSERTTYENGKIVSQERYKEDGTPYYEPRIVTDLNAGALG